MLDKPRLDMAPFVQVQVKINGGGLDVVMAQVVLDVRDGMAAIEHVQSAAVTEAVNGIDMVEALWRKNLFQMLPADTVDTMTGEFLPSLIDKEPVSIQGLWGATVFSDIALKQLTGLRLKLYEPKPVSLSQDGQRPFLRIKIIQVQRCYFAGPGAGVIEQMEQGIIPEPFFSFEINGLKELQQLILIEKPDKGLLRTLLGDVSDGIGHLLLFRIQKTDHFGKGFEGCKPLIAGPDEVLSFILQILKERDDELS